MRVVFFGTGAFGILSLEALKHNSHDIALCVTAADKPQGRRLQIQASPVKRWAQRHAVPAFEVSEIASADFLERLRGFRADIFVVISFGFILPQALLQVPRFLSLNVHSSLLPRYRGAAPVPWAIINGEKETGVTVIRMTDRLDAGDIVTQKKTALLDDDDIHSLEERLRSLGAEALVEAMERIREGSARFEPQEESRASYARKLVKQDGRIDWAGKAEAIRNRVRAMKDWPTSYTFYGGKRLIVEEVDIDTCASSGSRTPGMILSASKEKGIWVASADFPVAIRSLKLEGHKALAARDFLNGFSLTPGQSFE